MTASEFITETKRLKELYNTYDAYVQRSQGWNDNDKYEKCILAAYKIYELAKNPPLGALLLGDAGIRAMSDLLFNFGLASGTGVQDPDIEKLIAELADKRNTFNQSIQSEKDIIKEVFPPLIGPGSILSDQTWSTMLNDAFILGGIDGGHPFIFTLSNQPTKKTTYLLSEQQAWAQHIQKYSRPVYRPSMRTPLGRNKQWQTEWISFLKQYPEILYVSGHRSGPRVLARELLGLKFFGYMPVYSRLQLSFERAKHVPISFETYLDQLNKVQFFDNDNSPTKREHILSAIFEFLAGESGLTGDSMGYY